MKRGVSAEYLLGTLHQAIMPPARPNPVLMVWRWRYELTLLAGLSLTLVALVEFLGPNGTMLLAVIAGSAVLTMLIAWPAARHRLNARAWCILTPHRLRTGCVQARIYTRCGRLPAILWCAPKEYGEQVLIWCPAGVTAGDFLTARQILAAACYASKIEVVTHPRYRHIVILGVIRYQPSDLQSPDDSATQLGRAARRVPPLFNQPPLIVCESPTRGQRLPRGQAMDGGGVLDGQAAARNRRCHPGCSVAVSCCCYSPPRRCGRRTRR